MYGILDQQRAIDRHEGLSEVPVTYYTERRGNNEIEPSDSVLLPIPYRLSVSSASLVKILSGNCYATAINGPKIVAVKIQHLSIHDALPNTSAQSVMLQKY